MSEENAKADLQDEKFILNFRGTAKHKLARQKTAKSKISLIVSYPAPLRNL